MDELALLPVLSSKIRIREDNKKGDYSQGAGDLENQDDLEEEFSSDDEGDSTEFYKYFP